MNKYLIFLVLSLHYLFAVSNDTTKVISPQAVDTTKHHYLAISPSFNYYKHIDQQLSPLLYKGGLAGLGLAFESDGNIHKYNIGLSGFYGNLQAETNSATYLASQGIVNIHANYLHAIGYKEGRINKYLGASINHNFIFHINPNLQNASLSLSFLNNASISSAIEKEFSWKAKSVKIWFIKLNRRNRSLKVNFKLDLPLVFYNLRPPYSTISDFSNGENLWDLQSKSYLMGSGAFQLNTSTNLTYYLNNKNAFRIAYHWQAYRFKDTFTTYQAAQHVLEFSLLFSFN